MAVVPADSFPIPGETKSSRDVTEALPNRPREPKRERVAVRQGFEPWVGV